MLSCGDALATLTPAGGEFEVSTDTALNTYHSRVAADAAGGFVVVWQSYVSSETGGWNVAGRRFGGDGAPFADAFVVNTYTTGLQESPALAMSHTAEFLIAWQGPDAADTDAISARIYDAAGAAKGSQFRLHEPTELEFERAPSVAAASGSFLAAWLGNDGLAGTRIGGHGAVLGTFGETVSDLQRVAVDSLPRGEFVVVWSTKSYSSNGVASGYVGSVQGRRYAADGDPGDGFAVNGGRDDPTGYGFVIDGGQTLSVASDAHGGFAVGHDSYVPSYVYNVDEQVDGYDLGAKVQRFDGPSTSDSEFADPGAAASGAGRQIGPDVAVTAGGNTVVVWSDDASSPDVIDGGAPDTDGYAILARVLDCNGLDLTDGAVQVNAYTTGEQRRPAVAANEAGDVIITWQTPRQTGDGAKIVGRRFTLDDGCALCGDVDANGRITAGDALTALRASVGSSACELRRCDADGTESITTTDALRILTAAVANGGLRLSCAPGPVQVNQDTAGAQTAAKAAVLASERIAIAWTSHGQGDDTSHVFVRVFSAGLVAVGDEIRASTDAAGAQLLRAVSPLSDGGFLVTWDEAAGVFARRFDAGGAPVAEPFEVVGGLGDAFAADGEARFVVAEHAECTDDYAQAFACVAARRTPPEATSEGARFYTTPLFYDLDFEPMEPLDPVVAASSGGDFVVVWSAAGEHHENSYNHIYLAAFDANASPRGSEFFVGSTGPRRSPARVAAGDAGSFVVVWDTCTPQYDDLGYGGNDCYYAGVAGVRSTEGGDLQGFTVSDQKTYYHPSYADRVESTSINATNEFVVVWERAPTNDAAVGLLAQRYDEQADALGTRFPIVDDTDGFECCGQSLILPDGAVVVVWQGGDGDDSGVFARRFPSGL